MGLVTDTLLKLLQRQIEAHRTLVWYDPEHAYLDLALSLTPEQVAGAAVHRYEPEQGLLWMRRELEPLWAGTTDPPRLLLYVPLGQAEAENALAEFEVGGAVLSPGTQRGGYAGGVGPPWFTCITPCTLLAWRCPRAAGG